jgi:hypothetical protein
MDDHSVSFLPQFAQESPHLPLRDADFLGRLLLRDQFSSWLSSEPPAGLDPAGSW